MVVKGVFSIGKCQGDIQITGSLRSSSTASQIVRNGKNEASVIFETQYPKELVFYQALVRWQKPLHTHHLLIIHRFRNGINHAIGTSLVIATR